MATSIVSNGSALIQGLEQQTVINPPFAQTVGSASSFLPFSGFANAEVGRVFQRDGNEYYAAVSIRELNGHDFSSGVLYVKQNQNYVQLCDSLFGSPVNPFLQMEFPRNFIRGVIFYNNQHIIYGGFKSTSPYTQRTENMLAVISGILNVEEETPSGQKHTLFPNPTNSFLLFDDVDENATYTIYNQQGTVVKSGKLSSIIDVGSLPTGIYVFLQEAKDSFSHSWFIKTN